METDILFSVFVPCLSTKTRKSFHYTAKESRHFRNIEDQEFNSNQQIDAERDFLTAWRAWVGCPWLIKRRANARKSQTTPSSPPADGWFAGVASAMSASPLRWSISIVSTVYSLLFFSFSCNDLSGYIHGKKYLSDCNHGEIRIWVSVEINQNDKPTN